MAAPSRFKNGVTNVSVNDPMRMMPVLDPTAVHLYFNDFDTYNSSEWTVTTTEAGGGNASEAIGDADGGVLVITNDDADDDLDFLQLASETFKFVSGKKLWYKCRFKVSDATQSDIHIGLTIKDTTLLDVTDGVYFKSDDGDAYLDFGVEKNNTATATTAIATLVDNTYIVVGFYYDGVSSIQYSVDGVVKGTVATTNLCDDEELTVTLGIQNGAAAAKVLSVDYVMVCKER